MSAVLKSEFFETQEGAENFCRNNPGFVVSKRVRGKGKQWAALPQETAASVDVAARKVLSRNRVIPCEEFVGVLGPRQWRVKRVLPDGRGLVVIYGAPGDGKSFVIDDLATCVHRGTPWNGRRVKQGTVIYLVAEGVEDFKYRRAVKAHHLDVSLASLPPIIDNAPDLADERTVTDIIANIKAAGGCAAWLCDTFTSTFSGDENSSKDVGPYLKGAARIRDECNCLVILVCHVGKDRLRGMRGWSGTKGIVDAELEVTREGDNRMMIVRKMKGGGDGEKFGFKLKFIPLGLDEDGEEYGSCVPIYCEPEMTAAKTVRALGANEEKVLALVKNAPGQQLTTEAIKQQVVPTLLRGNGKADKRRYKVDRAIESLVNDGRLRLAPKPDGEESVELPVRELALEKGAPDPFDIQ